MKKILIFVYCLLICFCLSNMDIIAVESEPIYVEDEIIEENHLEGNIVHKKIHGRSMATRADLLYDDPKEAGYGSSVDLILNKYYSQQLNILEIPNESETKIVPWAVIDNGGWSLAKVTTMAEDYEASHPGWKVVAAINGDFFDINATKNYPYTSSGSMMVDGELYKASTSWPILGINNSGVGDKLVGLNVGEFSSSKLPYLSIYDENDNIIKEFNISKVNDKATGDEIAVYFALYDNKHKVVPITVENGYVVDSCLESVAFSKESFFGKGEITFENMTIELGRNQFAIQTSNSEVLSYLKQGVKIRVQHKMINDKLNNVDAAIGYHDKIIIDGEPTLDGEDYGRVRAPRTLIGMKEDGSIIMIVADGRQASLGYYGICQEELAAVISHYGMVNGYQLDGGGSSTMVILKDGKLTIMNSPSDSYGATARNDSNCLLVVMRVPIIDYQVNINQNSIEFTFDAIELLDEYKELYIDINGEKKKIINGTVIYDNLEYYTNYVYKFYSLVEDEYVPIVYQGKLTTPKLKPEVTGLEINIVEENGMEKYVIDLIVNDPNETITYAVLKVGEVKIWLNNGQFSYSVDKGNIITDDWSLEINYNLQNNNGIEKFVIEDCKLSIGSALVIFETQTQILNNSILDIFSIE